MPTKLLFEPVGVPRATLIRHLQHSMHLFKQSPAQRRSFSDFTCMWKEVLSFQASPNSGVTATATGPTTPLTTPWDADLDASLGETPQRLRVQHQILKGIQVHPASSLRRRSTFQQSYQVAVHGCGVQQMISEVAKEALDDRVRPQLPNPVGVKALLVQHDLVGVRGGLHHKSVGENRLHCIENIGFKVQEGGDGQASGFAAAVA
eukprot:scaffold2295_cov222-Pinguiococcus_pyrenoidosus.AAC.1